jgi:putative ABC transport system permease protein
MGIPLIQGRDFTRQDDADSPLVAVVDRTFAEQFWPDGDVLGKRLKFGSEPDSENPWMEVVGVVGHVKLNGVREDALRQIYLPFPQNSSRDSYLVVRTAGDPFTFVDPIRQLVNTRDPDLPLSDIQTMRGYLDENTRGDRLMTVLMSVFAATALLLAATGIYGVMSYTTIERLHEIGIRMALGAHAGQVVGMVVRQGLIRVAIGVIAGLVCAVGVGQLMESTLFGVTPLDLPTFVAAPVFLVLVAALASLIPAMRATAVDPVNTLRQE